MTDPKGPVSFTVYKEFNVARSEWMVDDYTNTDDEKFDFNPMASGGLLITKQLYHAQFTGAELRNGPLVVYAPGTWQRVECFYEGECNEVGTDILDS